jgi:putative chitinase
MAEQPGNEVIDLPAPPAGLSTDELNDWYARRLGLAVPDPLPHVVIPPKPAPSTDDLVTEGLLHRLGWVHAAAYAPALDAACREAHITTPKRIAAFLAQTGHESGGGQWRRELWGPTDAQKRYEGRKDLGNTQPGDGRRFSGRGLIQITGRYNTTQAWKDIRPAMPFEQFMAWLETVEGAARGAAWFWETHGCNEIADGGDFVKLTRRINGGKTGLDDRIKRWNAAKAALSVV